MGTVHTHTHQAQQRADLINGPQATEEAYENGESSNSYQNVACQLHICGVFWGSAAEISGYKLQAVRACDYGYHTVRIYIMLFV